LTRRRDAFQADGERLKLFSQSGDHPSNLAYLDSIIESIASTMADGVLQDQESGIAADESKNNKAAANALPLLKSLLVLRKAMSEQTFGHEKSPNDVRAIEEARLEAEKVAKGPQTTEGSSPQTSERGSKSNFNAADELMARADAVKARLRQGTERVARTTAIEAKKVEAPTAKIPVATLEKTKGARSEVAEREKREKELLAEILRDGASEITTSFSSKIPGTKFSGFQPRSEKRFGPERNAGAGQTFLSESRSVIRGRDADELLTSHGVNEVVGLYPAKEDVFENREVEVPKTGLFAFGRTEKRTERVKIGTRQVMHGERVVGGKQEPLVELIYSTVDNPYKKAYRDYSNRTGQFLSVTIRLPESLARRSLDLLQADPAFIRKMVEQTVIGQQGIPEGTWRSGELNAGFPLRPPYETWRTENEGKSNVYIRNELDGTGDGKFSEKNVFPVK
jgi:hypothetical protein